MVVMEIDSVNLNKRRKKFVMNNLGSHNAMK